MKRVRQVHRVVKSVQLAGDVRKELHLALCSQGKSGNRAGEIRRHYVLLAGDVFEAIRKVQS